jgi:hypothetical protein
LSLRCGASLLVALERLWQRRCFSTLLCSRSGATRRSMYCVSGVCGVAATAGQGLWYTTLAPALVCVLTGLLSTHTRARPGVVGVLTSLSTHTRRRTTGDCAVGLCVYLTGLSTHTRARGPDGRLCSFCSRSGAIGRATVLRWCVYLISLSTHTSSSAPTSAPTGGDCVM